MSKKVLIDEDEWWPVYDIYEPGDGSGDIEVDDALYETYQRVMKEFRELQAVLKKLGKYERS